MLVNILKTISMLFSKVKRLSFHLHGLFILRSRL